MSFLWLKSLGNKILGWVTSLFGLSSAGGTQPGNGNKKAEITNNVTLTQTQPKKKAKIILTPPSSTTVNPLAEPYREKSEENADGISVFISNELRTRLNDLKTALGDKDYDNAKTLSEAMYDWAGKQKKEKIKEPNHY